MQVCAGTSSCLAVRPSYFSVNHKEVRNWRMRICADTHFPYLPARQIPFHVLASNGADSKRSYKSVQVHPLALLTEVFHSVFDGTELRYIELSKGLHGWFALRETTRTWEQRIASLQKRRDALMLSGECTVCPDVVNNHLHVVRDGQL